MHALAGAVMHDNQPTDVNAATLPEPSSHRVPAAVEAVGAVGPAEQKLGGFLSHVHMFRALAIICIVAGHGLCFQPDWGAQENARSALLDLFGNGTVLFVFIAGYLFHHLSGKFVYSHYLRSKFRNVVLPYLLISIPAIALAIRNGSIAHYRPEWVDAPWWQQAAWYYLKGGAHLNYSLWFIPMITIFFVLAPLFMWVARHPRFYLLVPALLLVSMGLHRPIFPNLETGRLFVFFVPIYMLGMAWSQYRELADAWVARNLGRLACAWLALLVAQLMWGIEHGSYASVEVFDFSSGWIDWVLLQKLVACPLLLGLLQRYGHRFPKLLDRVADYSFSIYFFHVYVFLGLRLTLDRVTLESPVMGWGTRLVAGLVCSMLIAYLGRKIFGRYSRSIVAS